MGVENPQEKNVGTGETMASARGDISAGAHPIPIGVQDHLADVTSQPGSTRQGREDRLLSGEASYSKQYFREDEAVCAGFAGGERRGKSVDGRRGSWELCLLERKEDPRQACRSVSG